MTDLPQPTRFFVDSTVLRLGKWLRYLGLNAPRSLWNMETPPDGYLLTKKKQGSNISNRIIFVPHDRIEAQLIWFAKKFPNVIKPERFGSRCTLCNELLVSVSRDAVKDKVPDYIVQTQESFMMCPECRRIYWRGSHVGRMHTFLENINFPFG